jgi:uncharacterized protein (TIGR02145 family)
MKIFFGIIISFLFTANVTLAQDTLYVYQGGAYLYKRAVTSIDSLSFTYIAPIVGTIVDSDGHTYNYRQIGTQVWMTENLRTSKYRNGESISNPTVAADWAAATIGAWCNYDNNAATYDSKYGKLYNWYAVNDKRNIAPTGWHVATDAEWTTLTDYVAAHYGTSNSTAKALAATTDWGVFSQAGTIGANLTINNYSGFSALPGGYRHYDGTFLYVGSNGFWRTSTDFTSYAWNRALSSISSAISRGFNGKAVGYSVRCIRD